MEFRRNNLPFHVCLNGSARTTGNNVAKSTGATSSVRTTGIPSCELADGIDVSVHTRATTCISRFAVNAPLVLRLSCGGGLRRVRGADSSVLVGVRWDLGIDLTGALREPTCAACRP